MEALQVAVVVKQIAEDNLEAIECSKLYLVFQRLKIVKYCLKRLESLYDSVEILQLKKLSVLPLLLVLQTSFLGW